MSGDSLFPAISYGFIALCSTDPVFFALKMSKLYDWSFWMRVESKEKATTITFLSRLAIPKPNSDGNVLLSVLEWRKVNFNKMK